MLEVDCSLAVEVDSLAAVSSLSSPGSALVVDLVASCHCSAPSPAVVEAVVEVCACPALGPTEEAEVGNGPRQTAALFERQSHGVGRVDTGLAWNSPASQACPFCMGTGPAGFVAWCRLHLQYALSAWDSWCMAQNSL